MNFLKPDWRKIVIFIVIAIFAFLTIGEKGGCYVVDYFEKGYSETICRYSLYPLFWIFSNAEVNIETSKIFIYLQFLIKTYFIPLLYWYLISCLIIWIYDKFKKKSP